MSGRVVISDKEDTDEGETWRWRFQCKGKESIWNVCLLFTGLSDKRTAPCFLLEYQFEVLIAQTYMSKIFSS